MTRTAAPSLHTDISSGHGEAGPADAVPAAVASPEVASPEVASVAGRPAATAVGASPAAGPPAAARGSAATAEDEIDDWDPSAPDLGEEDQSLGAPDEDAPAHLPYC